VRFKALSLRSSNGHGIRRHHSPSTANNKKMLPSRNTLRSSDRPTDRTTQPSRLVSTRHDTRRRCCRSTRRSSRSTRRSCRKHSAWPFVNLTPTPIARLGSVSERARSLVTRLTPILNFTRGVLKGYLISWMGDSSNTHTVFLSFP
jgi:hypothetical protein